MPHALLPLPDVYESVTRRVATAVAAHLARIMHLPAETEILLPGNAETVPINNGEFGNCCAGHVRYPADTRLVVRYEEEANDNVTLTTGINNKENKPVWEDADHGIAFRPVWRYVNFTVTLDYIAPNITIAQRWLDEQRARISMGRAELFTDAEYHYALPKPLHVLAKALHDTMQASEFPTGEPYETWFNRHFTVPTTSVATLIDTNRTLVIVEKQVEILGWFNFTDGPPTPSRDANGTGTYTASFEYTFRYNRPTHIQANYPFLMHQKPIHKSLRAKAPYEGYRQKLRRVSKTKDAFDGMLRDMEAKRLTYVHYPETDDWLAPKPPLGRLTFFTGLVQLSKADLTTIVDLSDMGSLKFTPFYLEYFLNQGDKLFGGDTSIFEFRLYRNNEYLSGWPLEFVPDTTIVRSKVALDPTRYYHVQVSLRRNWYHLTPDTIQCLRRYPTVLYYAAMALGVKNLGPDPALVPRIGKNVVRDVSVPCAGEGWVLCTDRRPDLPWTKGDELICPRVIKDGVIQLKIIEDIIDQLDDKKDGFVNRNNVGPLNVMFADILTFKR